jgi:hypothetical protein
VCVCMRILTKSGMVGSVGGTFGLCGSVGILVCNKVRVQIYAHRHALTAADIDPRMCCL